MYGLVSRHMNPAESLLLVELTEIHIERFKGSKGSIYIYILYSVLYCRAEAKFLVPDWGIKSTLE
jgi:hypothetical protein